MTLTSTQIQHLATLITPAFEDESARKALLFMAFPNDHTKSAQFNVSQPGRSFAVEVVRKLYQNSRSDLLVLLQVVQEYMGGDLSRKLQPFVELLSQSVTEDDATVLSARKWRMTVLLGGAMLAVVGLMIVLIGRTGHGEFELAATTGTTPTPSGAQVLASLTIGAIIENRTDTAAEPSATSATPAVVLTSDTQTPTRLGLPTTTTLAAPTLIAAGTFNNVWTPAERDFEGVTMVLVPAGCFMMGSEDGASDEKPVHEICFERPFWIDQTEVTQAQFRQFSGTALKASYYRSDDHPVEQITWFEARDFCVQRGARLPTEVEWEYAARGPEGLIYPWGNTFESDKAIYAGNSGSRTTSVGSHPGGSSWVGALDMSGNVFEWTSSLYQRYPYQASDGREADTGERMDIQRVVRGGSWFSAENFIRASFRFRGAPGDRVNYVGFRCVRAYP
ncbi:MAG: formylglycine-generating enzyme family protein [Anaerolinea sp.]|nr:formylglycine-generating enzyme family protein [Anaerolinea sp.]CAG0963769.1 gamma-glutamyl hercynylcysteine S-oxide synthase [Anaerolineae bacterium]